MDMNCAKIPPKIREAFLAPPVVDLMLSEREQVNVYLCFEVLRKASINVRNLERRLVY